MGDVADGGQQGWVDQGGADPKEAGAGRPGREAAGLGGAGQRGGLQQHPADDEQFAAEPVRQRTREELAEAPYGRVERGQHPDPGHREAAAGKQER